MQTESSSHHRNLEALDFLSLVQGINQEDALLHARVASEASHIGLGPRTEQTISGWPISDFVVVLRLIYLTG